jgi:hypothetical protein
MNDLKRILLLAEINYIDDRNPQRQVLNRNNIRSNTLYLYKKLLHNFHLRKVFRINSPRNVNLDVDEYKKEILKVIFNIVIQVPLLSQYRIVSVLGSGELGLVLEIKNGRALKIGYETAWETPKEKSVAITYNMNGEDPDILTLNKNLLPIFGNGTIKVDKKSTLYFKDRYAFGKEGSNMYWTEIPLLQMLSIDEKHIWDSVHYNTKTYLMNLGKEHLFKNPQELESEIIEDLIKWSTTRTLSTDDRQVLSRMMKAVLAQVKVDGHFKDAHGDNVGKFIQSGDYVVFDN